MRRTKQTELCLLKGTLASEDRGADVVRNQ